MTEPEAWTRQDERGSVWLIRLAVWLALRLGRAPSRWLLYPACLYFLLAAGTARAAYLGRVLERPPTLADRWRHFHSFAACVLDRVFLLDGQDGLFDITVEGAGVLDEMLRQGRGCLLLGAHLGSFEVLRAVARVNHPAQVSLLMYAENARITNLVLDAINPDLRQDVIALGDSASMLTVAGRLDAGHLVGMLADRGLDRRGMQAMPFLGAPALFPTGPFRLAALLRRPVVLMFGLYRGGNRYEVRFELLDIPEPGAPRRRADPEALMCRYVDRLAVQCQQAPYNWFNFYPFWT
jgi:predicted LPLAT superfamily acyltransferase